MDVPVIIAGAGPTGLVLAIELRRRGIDCLVVEQLDRLFEGARGKGLQPRTLEVLEDLGVLGPILEHGCEYPQLLIHLPGGQTTTRTMAESRPATEDVPYPNGWMVPQWRTGRILAARLAELGGRIEFGTELVGFTRQTEGVAAKVNAAGTLTAL